MNCSTLNEIFTQITEPFFIYTSALVIALLLFLFILLKRQPKHIVAYKTDNGSVTVSRLAIIELVRTSCAQFPEITKPSIKIRTRGKHTHLTIYVKFLGGSQLREIEKILQDHLRQNLSENLGIENLGNINMVVTGFKSRKIVQSKPNLETYNTTEPTSEKLDLEESASESEKST